MIPCMTHPLMAALDTVTSSFVPQRVSRAPFSTLDDCVRVYVSNQMRHLEFDVANSTPNPLYVPTTRAGEAEAEEANASSSRSDDHTHGKNHVREYFHYCRGLQKHRAHQARAES